MLKPWETRMIRSPLSSALSSAVLAVGIAVIALQPAVAQQPQTPPTATMTPDPLAVGKQALAHNDYETAQTFFANYLKDNPESTEALLFAGNTALALKQYESAAHDYQSVIAKQPSLWPAHKNLVIAYAAQNKWPEFEQERKLLQAARDRGTPGLSSKDVDVIEVLYAGSERYMVRAYSELTGRFKPRYNFTHFGKDGKLDFWISCESDDIDQVSFAQKHPKEAAAGQRSFSLDSYTPAAPNSNGQGFTQTHGTLKFYPDGEPSYETVRADVIKVLEHRTGPMSTTTSPSKPATPETSSPAPH
jgi:tetratricopeptide (TPR) repeat protein